MFSSLVESVEVRLIIIQLNSYLFALQSVSFVVLALPSDDGQ
jgi:hypothetical protein